MRIGLAGLGPWLLVSAALGAQPLAQRVAAVRNGEVRFAFAARPGVVGDGEGSISWGCTEGRCEHNWSKDRRRGMVCEAGPVRVRLRIRDGVVRDVDAFVGGAWEATDQAVTDLGTVAAREAARWLLDLARRDRGAAGREAIPPAVLADSVTTWPTLLEIARDTGVPEATRRQAVFWVGQAAEEAATQGLEEIVDSPDGVREVQKSAVFALSQRPRDEGVPALIRVARTHRDPEIRRQAVFWLGQANDPRALAFFEQILTRP